MVKMFEIEMEVIAHNNKTEKNIRDLIKRTLNSVLDVNHISVELSEKKVKDWTMDIDRNYNVRDFL